MAGPLSSPAILILKMIKLGPPHGRIPSTGKSLAAKARNGIGFQEESTPVVVERCSPNAMVIMSPGEEMTAVWTGPYAEWIRRQAGPSERYTGGWTPSGTQHGAELRKASHGGRGPGSVGKASTGPVDGDCVPRGERRPLPCHARPDYASEC